MSLSAKIARDRYLGAPLVIDTEYIKNYTQASRETEQEGILHSIERRAECHARAIERLTPTIFPDEPLVGHKTRFVRGAVPYCHYASRFILRELANVQQEAQDSVTEVGTGGGIAKGKEIASRGEFATFGKKFLIRKDELPVLEDCAKYWASGRAMQEQGDRLWKTSFPQSGYIESGWKSVLYTAAHDPAPEGRYVLDFETALAKGLSAVAGDCEERAVGEVVTDGASAEKVRFWRAAARVLRATISWAGNYAKEARRIAEQPGVDDLARARLLSIAERCERVPAKPPRDFADAVQAFWFVYLAGHLEGAHLGYSPGRFDQYMHPFLGDFPRERALELLECLRVQMTSLEYVSSMAWEGLGSGNLFQNMILGGLTEDGRPADNVLSMLVVQAAINCKTTQPTLSVWWDPSLSDAFLLKCAECVKTGVGFPAWFNLKTYIQHELEVSGLPLATIRKYAAMGGCTEPTLMGHSYGIVQAGFVNLCKVLEIALHGGKDPRTGQLFEPRTPLPQSAEELASAFEVHLAVAVRNWQRYWNYVMAAHRLTVPLIFSSALIRDCIGRGRCLDDGGAVHNGTPTTLSSGMVNVVNSVAAVRSLVDEQKLCSMDELREALLADWRGHERLQEAALRAPKWGNNDDRADLFFVRFFDSYCKTVRKQLNYLGKPYDPSMLAISTHAPFGRACLATPDGRKSGQTLADGVTSPYPGTDVSGPFSVLLSAGKIDHTRIRGGLHNLKLHPTTVMGARGSRKLLNLVGSYFRSSSSFQVQFNIVDSRTLKEAQEHPLEHRDLIVRVAGFSAYFVELAKPIQDEVIARTEHEIPGQAGSVADTEDFDDDDDEHGALSAVQGTIFDFQDFTIHDGSGVRSTVFLKGCPLHCGWCCNPESQRFDLEEMTEAAEAGSPKKAVGKLVTAGEVLEMARSRAKFYTSESSAGEGAGGVTLSGGEPLAQPSFARALVLLIERSGISVAIETSGQWSWDAVGDVFKHISLVYFDLKAGTTTTHKRLTGVDGILIASNLARVIKAIGAQRVIVSVPLVHGANDSDEEVDGILSIAKSAGARRVRLLPYHALGESKYQRLGRQAAPISGAAVPQEVLEHIRDTFVAKGFECSIMGRGK